MEIVVIKDNIIIQLQDIAWIVHQIVMNAQIQKVAENAKLVLVYRLMGKN